MNSETQISTLFKRVCQLQILYCIFVAAWNIAGLILLNMGQQALGPTASLMPVLALALMTSALVFSGIKQSKLYPLLAGLILIMAVLIVAQAFIKPATLWPSDAWRYAGVAVNAFGALSAALGLFWYFKRC